MAPRNIKQLDENIKALEDGPLSLDEMSLMREFGDVVHHTRKWSCDRCKARRRSILNSLLDFVTLYNYTYFQQAI